MNGKELRGRGQKDIKLKGSPQNPARHPGKVATRRNQKKKNLGDTSIIRGKNKGRGLGEGAQKKGDHAKTVGLVC